MIRQRAKAQALVELALAATLIFMLVSATVDLGLIFLSRQALRAAAQEGGTFGSFPQIVTDAGGRVTAVRLNEDEIRRRVRLTAGTSGGPDFVNILDLNNNRMLDNAESPDVLRNYIQIDNLLDTDNNRLTPDGDPNNPDRCSDTDMRRNPDRCYIRVRVRYDYRPVFPFAPVFGVVVPLQESFTMQVRSSYRETL